MNPVVLYICYFGLSEPLVQTQVLTYLREIKKIPGCRVSILTFEPNFAEKWSAEDIAEQKHKLAAEGITWYALPYHKSPSVPATLYDIFCGVRLVLKLIRRENINILHARHHLGAMIGAPAKKLSGGKVKMIFDIRGFFPEEYTDAGTWKENGTIFKTVKRIEKKLYAASDGFVVLTEKARDILFPESRTTGRDKFGKPVEVIPCCVNLRKFPALDANLRRETRREMNLGERFVVTYVGSLGTWYMAQEMTDFLATAKKRDPSTFALILTQSAPDEITQKIKENGFSDGDFSVKRVPHNEIPKYLSAADAALSFIKPCYSKLSSSPTKIAEYLASGVPVITNRGVGDVAEQIETDNVGAVIEDFTSESYNNALRQIEELRKVTTLAERCRQSAEKRFDLENVGGEQYRRLYRAVLES